MMKKILSIILFAVFLIQTAFAQIPEPVDAFPESRIVGGAGVVKIVGNPNAINSLKVIDERQMSATAWDTVTNRLWVYKRSLAVGKRWRLAPFVEYSNGTPTTLSRDTAYKWVVDTFNRKGYICNQSGCVEIGAGSTITSGNGVNINSGVANLGGSLSANAQIIVSSGANLKILGLQSGFSTDSVLVVDPINGTIRRVAMSVISQKEIIKQALPPSDTMMIWKNPNISVIQGQTTDYSYKNGLWQPMKDLDVTDAGAIGDGVTDNTEAYTKLMSILPNGGIMYFPKGNFKGIIYLNGKVSVKGDGESSIITSLNDSSAIVISYFSVVSEGTVKISDVRINGYNGIEFRHHFAGRVQGENINIQVSNIGIWKREGNIYNTWKNCQIRGGNYGVYAVNSPTEIMHAGAEEFLRCRFTGASKAGYYLNDVQDGAGQINFQDSYLEGNAGFGVFVKSFGSGRNILPIVFTNTWNEANGTLDSTIIDGTKYKVYNYFFRNTQMATLKGCYVGTLKAEGSNIILDNCFIDNEIIKDTTSYVSGSECYINSINTADVEMQNISGFYKPVQNSFKIKGVQNIIKKNSNVIFSYNYADAALVSGAVRQYEKYLYDSCQSKVISGFTLLSPFFYKTLGKYHVVSMAVKNLSTSTGINFAYNVGLCQFLTTDTLWHTYVGIGYNGNAGTVCAAANGTGTVYMSALQYLEFSTYSEALSYANSKCYADNNSTKVDLWAVSGNTIIPKLPTITIGGTTNTNGYLLNVQGDAYFNASFTTFVNDGVFGATIKPIIINNYNGQTRIGYYSSGDGQYYGRIGHITGANKVSYGAIGANEFSINTGTSNTERLRVNNIGIGINISNPLYKLDIDSKTGSSGNPIRLLGLNVGENTDSSIVANAGVLKRIATQSIVSKVFQDSCINSSITITGVGANNGAGQSITFGRSIQFPQIHLTPQSSGVGVPVTSWAYNVTSTGCSIGVQNLGVSSSDITINYRICPNNGQGY